MGTFGKTFTREIGKNTGKWVSNKVFGDGHATPYRFVSSGEKKANINLKIEEQKAKTEAKKYETELEILEQKLSFKREEKIERKIEAIHALKIPNNRDQLLNYASRLFSITRSELVNNNPLLFSFKGTDNESGTIILACLEKLDSILYQLETNGDLRDAQYVEKKLNGIQAELSKSKRSNSIKSILLILLIIGGVTFALIAEKLGIKLD